MNAVVLAVLIMMALSLSRVPVVLALILSAAIGGIYAGLTPDAVVQAFNSGLGAGAPVALAYATLGAFAIALSRTGIVQGLSGRIVAYIQRDGHSATMLTLVKWSLLACLVAAGFASGTIIPVHIAFIPILVPPLLLVMNRLRLDRRAVACAITFSITVMYMTLPIGFGAIFLNDILVANINKAGAASQFRVSQGAAPLAMLIPAAGMVFGLALALLVSYRRPRAYQDVAVAGGERGSVRLGRWQRLSIGAALLLSLLAQLWTGSMVFGGLVGFALISGSGVMRWTELDNHFTQGMRLMAQVGFIMIAAAGFASVMNASGDVQSLVSSSVALIGDNRGLAAFMMLLVGLLITMGIGSSFSTVPIIASIYVPLALGFGFSELAVIALVGTAAALGDAGSPASDSTLGPTAGLSADGQHDHMWGTVVPTFLHFNLPLLGFGWIATMLL
ncbi:putative histidine transporter YuiF (NhaC family) [Chromobacterium alkanivorans]|uniref:Na+/H+ antiporter family protein n=1 Tax=Chromobacterium alkanivorans TaxID=1071719 RepID=UPI00216A9FCC|nr:Na+/H+ antiporter NhaC family protein [Chromobacterium alkanivorans]MCS3803144.1 putative histidine transporter YuiF (NhaC family) [Chromobacterium alkanivorans]MCS3817746.1 putative histidine transporter YuiF (NhaC family) [Chromobacterium alkanivorans]MCS3872510.1 putative histidine transporter YuiF (NhaC family) [Chromobacterium alkanivorans]